MSRILVIDDNLDILLAAKLLLKPHVKAIQTEPAPERIPDILSREKFDVILLDMNFTKDASSGAEGFFWLKKILEHDPSAVVIMMTAYGDIETAVRAIREGAIDFVIKPWQNEKLLATISAALKLRASRDEAAVLRSRQKELIRDLRPPMPVFIGESVVMKKIFLMVEKVAATDASVLILGESGTGKDLVARAIHERSHRAENIFLSVDMGAISETLFESELFGHVKGAFTDAKEDRVGKLEAASGGTLFLDEIGNLSPALQAKLLTALQQQQVTRLGTNAPRPFNVRLICATNMPLYEMVAEKKFRQDLLYRINTVELVLPPLRERDADITLLAEHYLDVYTKKYRKALMGIDDAAMKKLKSAVWAGNVRELQHTIERAVIMSESKTLTADDFELPMVVQKNFALSSTLTDTDKLSDLEKSAIQRAMQKHNGNITEAAKELGLTRASLYRRLEKYAL
jgi:two-component system, NtrC family, response regulator HydG